MSDTVTTPDFSVIYKGLTNRQIDEAQEAEPCPHGTTRGNCGSSMCVVWTVDELNADRDPADAPIDHDAIPFP
jgi:hypothetical protein